MNEKLLELYERCMRNNIMISIRTCLSDGWIEIQGDTLVYHKNAGMYEHIRNVKQVTTDLMRYCDIDIIEYIINKIFQELLEERRELEDE